MYEIFLTKDARNFYKRAEINIVRKLNRCFDQLRQNPYEHPNIKTLKGILSGHYRYRVGDYRVIYRINTEPKQVFM